MFPVERTAIAIERRSLIALIPFVQKPGAPSQARVSEVYLFKGECCPSASWGHTGHNGEILAAAASRSRPRESRRNGGCPWIERSRRPNPRRRIFRDRELLNCGGHGLARELPAFWRKRSHNHRFGDCKLSRITKLIISQLTLQWAEAAIAAKFCCLYLFEKRIDNPGDVRRRWGELLGWPHYGALSGWQIPNRS